MLVFFAVFVALLASPVVWPETDLYLSALFFRAGAGFLFDNNAFLAALNLTAYNGSRVLAGLFAVLFLAALMRCKAIVLDKKAWLFLLVALLIGPGLIANVGFKDHWGRARPREAVEFGGSVPFSPALSPHFDRARSNGSFVSGDGAFGFFLPAFAFVVPRRYARRTFWTGMAIGAVFGFARLASGAHFFSDVIYAAFFVLASTTAIHALMYGAAETKARWNTFFNAASRLQPL